MTAVRLLVCAVLVAAACAWPSLAAAASRVALVRSANDETKVTYVRLRAELESGGFEVVEIDPSTNDPRAQAEAGRAVGAFATVSVVPAADGAPAADVWVADHVTGKTLVREVRVDRNDPSAPSVVALRAVELLRASLLEAEDFRTKEAEHANVPTDVAKWMNRPEPEPPRVLVKTLAVQLGAALVVSPGELEPSLGPTAGVWLALGRSVSMRASFIGPTFGTGDVNAAFGSAAVRQESGLAEIAFHPVLVDSWLHGLVALGAGAHHLHARGHATAPNMGRSDDAWGALFSAELGAVAQISNHVAFTLSSRVLFAAPPPTVRMVGVPIAEAGRPAIVPTIGMMSLF